jgi:hypothetical protein
VSDDLLPTRPCAAATVFVTIQQRVWKHYPENASRRTIAAVPSGYLASITRGATLGGAALCPSFVPFASKPCVIRVIVARAKGRNSRSNSAKSLMDHAWQKAPGPDCKTSTPGSNPGGASKTARSVPVTWVTVRGGRFRGFAGKLVGGTYCNDDNRRSLCTYGTSRRQVGPSPIFTTLVTNVTLASPTRPVTSQHPGVGKMTYVDWKPRWPYPPRTSARKGGAVASRRRPSMVS